jgi:hypothetical protein
MSTMATKAIRTADVGFSLCRPLPEWHHLQRTSVARSVDETAIKRTYNRIRSAHPSVKVGLRGLIKNTGRNP